MPFCITSLLYACSGTAQNGWIETALTWKSRVPQAGVFRSASFWYRWYTESSWNEHYKLFVYDAKIFGEITCNSKLWRNPAGLRLTFYGHVNAVNFQRHKMSSPFFGHSNRTTTYKMGETEIVKPVKKITSEWSSVKDNRTVGVATIPSTKIWLSSRYSKSSTDMARILRIYELAGHAISRKLRKLRKTLC